MITPKQISDSLEIPPSTLRRWAKRFETHLSTHRPGKHRSYTPSDLYTFQNIKKMLDQNQTYDEIDQKLDVMPAPSENKTAALLTLSDFTQIIEEARSSIQALHIKIDDQDQRIEKLESWIITPWHKRIFKKPPEI